jgi:hypothetical protein
MVNRKNPQSRLTLPASAIEADLLEGSKLRAAF